MRKSVAALFPKTRSELLAATVLQPESWWYLSDLAKHLRVTPSTLQRELKRLTDSGILQRRVDGKRVYFRADEKCPILGELQGIFLKTTGLVDVLAASLKPVQRHIQVASVFGSIAKGEELSRSDVDLLIVGEVGLAELAPYLRKAESKLRREIQAMVYREQEFRSKLRAKDHFLTTVLKEPALPVIGNLHEFVEKVRG